MDQAVQELGVQTRSLSLNMAPFLTSALSWIDFFLPSFHSLVVTKMAALVDPVCTAQFPPFDEGCIAPLSAGRAVK